MNLKLLCAHIFYPRIVVLQYERRILVCYGHLQFVCKLSTLWIVPILFCYSRSPDTFRTSLKVLHHQERDFLIILARYKYHWVTLWWVYSILFHNHWHIFKGVLLAVLEKAKFIDPVIDSSGQPTSAGTVSAGYQNFLICIEMLFASLALRAAFPYEIYANNAQTGTGNPSNPRTVTMQSISSSLKVRFNKYVQYVIHIW